MQNLLIKAFTTLLVSVYLIVTTPAFANQEIVAQSSSVPKLIPERAEQPGPFTMAADAIIARPLLLAATVIGSALFVVSLPFSALGGNVKEAGDSLVLVPARATFKRCLGCSISNPDH